jgi:hypothetical protein
MRGIDARPHRVFSVLVWPERPSRAHQSLTLPKYVETGNGIQSQGRLCEVGIGLHRPQPGEASISVIRREYITTESSSLQTLGVT